MLQNKTVILLIVIVVSNLLADEPPTLNITKTFGNITVDGHLDDEGWVGSSSSSEFVEVRPGENLPPIVKTNAFITYDDKNLYISFKAFDDPSLIRAKISKRDQLYGDDFCGILLDTYGDANRAYQLMVNPIGIQGDGQKIGTERDASFDLIFESAGMITNEGYQVEIALPFSSIRFPNDQQQHWRIAFFRARPRDDFRRMLAWPQVDRNNPCELCQLGYLEGINGIQAKRSIEFLPSLVGTQSGSIDSNNVFKNGDINSDIALGVKIPIGETTTVEVAINPDFSQVEADVTQFDVNSQFALSYPERRPFFNEGSDLFNTGGPDYLPSIKPVYTRSINDPSLAVKVLGRNGDTDFGIISARDEKTAVVIPFEDGSSMVSVGESNVNIFRLKHSLDNSSFIGGVLTDKRYSNGHGTNLGLDGTYYINQNWILNGQATVSYTSEPIDTSLSSMINGYEFGSEKFTSDFDGESYYGNQYFVKLSRNTRNSFTSLFLAQTSPTFRLDSGFLNRNHQRHLGIIHNYVWYPKTDLIEDLNASFGYGNVWNYNQKIKEIWFYSGLNIDFKGRLSINIDFLPTSELFMDKMFNGLYQNSYNVHKSFNEKFNSGIFGSKNKTIIRYLSTPEKGKTQSLGFYVNYNPTDKLSFNTSINYNDATYLEKDGYYYKGQRIRIYSTYQFNRYISLRFISQYFYQEDFIYEVEHQSFDIHPLLSYQPNPFTIFYIGSSHDFDEGSNGYKSFDMLHKSRQIFLKFQYLFQT